MIKKIYFDSLGSTNSYAVENIEALEDQTVIIADMQSRGRGRNERLWFSEKNNLFVSLVLKPEYDFEKKCNLNALTHYTAVVLTRVLKQKYSIETQIKWPNDILAGGKKIAGILIETVIKGRCLQGVVVGIGVNLNLKKQSLGKIGQPAASLNMLLQKEIDRDEFLEGLLEEFFIQYDEILSKGFLLIKKEYNSLNTVLDKMVEVAVFGKKYYGIVKKIDDRGQLVLDCNNKEKVISVGDIIC